MAKLKKQHAEIAEFHARNFYAANAKSFYQFNMTGGIWKETHARKAGTRDNFFDVDDGDPKRIEKWMGLVESAADQSITRLLADHAAQEQDIVNILQYCALLRARSPAVQASILGEMAPQEAPAGLKRVLYALSDTGEIRGLRRDLRVHALINSFNESMNGLASFRTVEVGRSSSDFIVGDSAALFLGFTDSAETEIALPLTPRTIVRFREGDFRHYTSIASDRYVAVVNSLTLISSSDHIFCARPLFSYTADGADIRNSERDIDPRTLIKFVSSHYGRPGHPESITIPLIDGKLPHHR